MAVAPLRHLPRKANPAVEKRRRNKAGDNGPFYVAVARGEDAEHDAVYGQHSNGDFPPPT